MMEAEEDNTKENEVRVGVATPGDELGKSLEALENVAKILACAKCGTIPLAKDKVYTLGNCFHKYCSPCAANFSGKAQRCVAPGCEKMKVKPGKAVEDTFSSSVMIGLLKLKADIKRTPRVGNPLGEQDQGPSSAIPNDSIALPAKKKKKSGTVEDSPKVKGTKHMIEKSKDAPAKGGGRNESPDIGDPLTTGSTKKRGSAKGRKSNLDKDQLTKKTSMERIPAKVKKGRNESPDMGELPQPKTPTAKTSASSRKRSASASNKATPEVAQSKPVPAKRGRKSSDMNEAGGVGSSTTPKRGRPKSGNVAIQPSEATPTPSKLDKKNSKGETLLHISCRKGELEKVQELVSAGANPNVQDHGGWTPLHEAINGKGNPSCKLDIVKLLFEHGSCNPNIPGMDKEMALHDSARGNLPDIIVYLLAHGASPNIRNKACKLPRDVAATPEIAKMLEEASKFADEFLVDDPAVLEIQMSTALVHLKYNVSTDLNSKIAQILKIKLVNDFRTEVTHIVFECDGSGKEEKVPLSLEYLFGIATGAWMLNFGWITKSLAAKKVLSPSAFEIFGCTELETESTSAAARRARLNREIGNPGLLHGFCFYFYKNIGFKNIDKKDLISVVNLAGGLVITLPPNPNDVDPLEHPIRYHAKEDNHKLVLTSHIILYNEDNKPSASKMYNMEHIKCLRISWLIDSLRDFQIKDPDCYL